MFIKYNIAIPNWNGVFFIRRSWTWEKIVEIVFLFVQQDFLHFAVLY